MFTDVLGIAIAFVSIILVLSIIVTAMVQMTQALLRLRARNLLVGIATLIRSNCEDGSECTRMGYRTRSDDKKTAARILNSVETGTVVPVGDPTSFLHYNILGPKISWIDQETLGRAATDVKVDVGQDATLEKRYPLVQRAMGKRFLLLMRLWALFWAAVVAVAFQVSTPELVTHLSTNTEHRERLVLEADRLLADTEEVIARFHDYETAAADALEVLEERFPDAIAEIEQASGIGVNKDYIIAELALSLRGHPQREEIVRDYESLLDAAHREAIQNSQTAIRVATDTLSIVNIRFWGDSGFFQHNNGTNNWQRIIGVLMTTILLMLGAPFWFNALRNLVSLRDALTGRREPASISSDGDSSNQQ